MSVQSIRNKLLDRDLCNHCLGRQFALLGHGLENFERGAILRRTESPTPSSITPEQVPEDARRGGTCFLCEGLFQRIEEFARRIIDRVNEFQLKTYLVGTRIWSSMIEREKTLREEVGVQNAESIKRELNRLIGKELETRYEGDISVHQEEPDIMMIVDIPEDTIELQVSSLYVFGRYNKYARDLPQTVWHCRECRGSGCEYCEGSGKMYETSVQEQIQDPFLEQSGAEEAVFHGAGREDIDARCLGKRPFVLELKTPRIRDLDLANLTDRVNSTREDVEIFDVQLTRSHTVGQIKQFRADKTYRATVSVSDPIDNRKLEQIHRLEGEIQQETPSRVAHRRSDRTRCRTVHVLEAEQLSDKEFELRLKAEAGTYIKEFISGDDERTKPNLSSYLNTRARCEKLDVTEIHEDTQVDPPAHEDHTNSPQ